MVTVTDVFSLTGAEQTFVVPDNIISDITAKLYGPGGGGGDVSVSGGNGGYVEGTIAQSSYSVGETFYIYVGGGGEGGIDNGEGGGAADTSGGFNGGVGGGYSFLAAGGSGGASDIRQGGNTLSDRIAVAGGGGSGAAATSGHLGGGGDGGADTGQDGGSTSSPITGSVGGGSGGTQTAGGAGDRSSGDGSLGSGGPGYEDVDFENGTDHRAEGGGGGGGYYGGGGGGAAASASSSDGDAAAGGGGGGSNYDDGLDSVTANERGTGSSGGGPGEDGGDGLVILEYEVGPYVRANDGSNFIPAEVKYWDGTSWNYPSNMSHWDGSSWTSLPDIRYQVENVQLENSTDVSAQVGTGSNTAWGDTGSRFYVIDQGASVYQYNMGTEYDVTTKTFDTSYSVSSEESTPDALTWSPSGGSFFIAGIDSGQVHQYSVSTAWDIGSTVTHERSESLQADGQGLSWGDNGNYLYVANDFNNVIERYSVSNPYDIFGLSFDHDMSTGSNHAGVAISPDGETLSRIDASSPTVFEQFTLSTPWDLTTAGSATTVNGTTDFEHGMSFSHDGFRSITIAANDTVYSYLV